MAAQFHSTISADRIVISLVETSLFGRNTPLPYSDWSRVAKDRDAIRSIETLVEDGTAFANEMDVVLSPESAAGLSAEAAERFALPPLVPLGLAVALDGRIDSPEGRLDLRWTDKSGRQVRPERTGILVEYGDRKRGRLSAPVYRVVEAAEGYNRTIGRPLEERLCAWMPMQGALAAVKGTEVQRDGYLETFTLYQAGSFALDVHHVEDGLDFTPILMSRSKAGSLLDEAPAEEFDDIRRGGAINAGADRPSRATAADSLLSPDDHRSFVDRAFRQRGSIRDAYVVGRNRYVVIDASLRQALDVVKSKRSASIEERRQFLRNPRAALADALGSQTDETLTAVLFVETKSYSDRVEGLGKWERPRLPWLSRPPNQWLPEAGWVDADGGSVNPPPLNSEDLTALKRSIEEAESRGSTHVAVRGVPVPLDEAWRVFAHEQQRTENAGGSDGPAQAANGDPPGVHEKAAERQVLVIKKTNFEGLDYVLAVTNRRSLIPPAPPRERMAETPLKLHQEQGFEWLTECWRAGLPGALLADDMGLGKTYQALAFLAWVKSNADVARQRGIESVVRGPVLVVAPTALLKNWEKECGERLSALGLGERVDAYGRALGSLKLHPSRRADPGETLDVARLRDADWILTTYETLTNHERAFAPIHYAVVLFDEMQKVKAPDTLNTKTAKTLNADFVLGLTGTPVENRMEDLWCIFDRLIPGYLGDLKTFSTTYREDAEEKLIELKKMLDMPSERAPPVMKRRMKADILDGLPKKIEKKYPAPMPPEQAQAYRELIAEAHRGKRGEPGFMLRILHQMRGISLHPDGPGRAKASTAKQFETFAARSARLTRVMAILHDIRKRREKALVFLEDIGMQGVLAEGIAASFDLDRKPAIINGGTPGEKRLAIVESFERSGEGFGVLVLSPRAAGVGLNIVSANHVIHLSRWWNPAVEDQCNDRAYRIGQIRDVTIHLPMAIHPDFPKQSFDEQLDYLIERKRQLSRHMLAPPTSDSDADNLFRGTVPPS
jgi:SNF2 family DNA or RNA helicase